MEHRYEEFCLADPLFFDEQRGSAAERFARFTPLPEEGWAERQHGTWRVLHPLGASLPYQGWKIHVSATLDNAEQVLTTVYECLVERAVTFKHLTDLAVLLARNSKYAPREASGKLVTIYPRDDREFETLVTELDQRIGGQAGPYILSDLRYGDGPLYVRYGGFTERWIDSGGTRVLGIAREDGTLVPDHRGPVFALPDWVELPEFLAPHLAARSAKSTGDFAYHVNRPLHFSNGGGVYLAEHAREGNQVVLKEARPHAGLDGDKVDAVARLRREHRALTSLTDVPGVPAVYELTPVWEHLFLAMEHRPGVPLHSWLGANYPLTNYRASDSDVAAYTRRALGIADRIGETVSEIHLRGLVFNDLHPANVLVTDDDSVSLIDFELAGPPGPARRPTLGAPGFRAPADRTGFEVDDYALAALRLWLFLPLSALFELAPAKLPEWVRFVEDRFPLPNGYGESILATLRRGTREKDDRDREGRAVGRGTIGHRTTAPVTVLDDPEPDWNLVRKSIAQAILTSATPERPDRLFPGDIEQFRLGGLGFGHGAAGVLHALAVEGLGRSPEHDRWLRDAIDRNRPLAPGFLDGAAGIAYVLHGFGDHDTANALLADARRSIAKTRDHGLANGLAGIGLTLLYLGDGGGESGELGERLVAELESAAPPGRKAKAGLVEGWSGPALLFTRLFEATGDGEWLVHAERALSRDLAECVPARDGSMQVRDGVKRTLPFLGTGSAGIAMAAMELAKHTSDDGTSVRQLPLLLRACRAEAALQCGLLAGRGGLLATLAAARRYGHDPTAEDAIASHLARLAWHAIPFALPDGDGDDGIAFPGNKLLRLSMDVATGSAGVLLSISTALDDHSGVLPFLAPVPTVGDDSVIASSPH
ncbi:serine/threonine protein kinase [Prauserella marina]|uniref:non-specific serine/threonine protein kinase n=1 Tax=Prauserella marina TaxID=530584 RepID=A0A222VKV6_9PSEU|nr:class III lanthionine synthetase LanKC [Prauserella marina]ASR34555.1 serine/threonine protein kinase [Prauserella marina]PWV85828.1 protein kinase-like protein [Prauserella marina]SDC44510.1 Protein kinase domain-containing protein [Prauserella marina]